MYITGAVAGVALAAPVLRGAPAPQAVRSNATLPGIYGITAAFLAEVAVSFLLMTAILVASNHRILAAPAAGVAPGTRLLLLRTGFTGSYALARAGTGKTLRTWVNADGQMRRVIP
jgi:glycerol uptake facilitator-like aquaporin